jgi:Asp-tRNA(Asn)/Glu-tRNA(Gln) amidotransferase A subunit family amidase
MWTLLVVPFAALPAGWADSGLPTAVQLIGRVHGDTGLMACTAFLEQALTETA